MRTNWRYFTRWGKTIDTEPFSLNHQSSKLRTWRGPRTSLLVFAENSLMSHPPTPSPPFPCPPIGHELNFQLATIQQHSSISIPLAITAHKQPSMDDYCLANRGNEMEYWLLIRHVVLLFMSFLIVTIFFFHVGVVKNIKQINREQNRILNILYSYTSLNLSYSLFFEHIWFFFAFLS